MGDELVATARVLVVDDEPPNVRLLARLLEGSGYENVATTTDPEEALKLTETFDPDILLLDLLMPRLDGIEVIRRIRQGLAPNTFLPIVVLTADVTPEAKRRALDAGADDFLTKPFEPDEVLLRVRNLLRTRGLTQDLERERGTLERRVLERTAALEESFQRVRRGDEIRRRLLSHLVRAQEEERQLIAGDIHDDSVQVMTAVSIRLQLLRDQLPEGFDDHNLVRLRETVEAAIARLRGLLFDLSPIALDDRGGLASAIAQLVERLRDDGVPVSFEDHMHGEPGIEARVVMFRIIQEAVNNARKHANANAIEVALENASGGFEAVVRDDGLGFDVEGHRPAPGHLGVPSMRERAEIAGGSLSIDSAPGSGTSVRCWLPDAGGPSPADD